MAATLKITQAEFKASSSAVGLAYRAIPYEDLAALPKAFWDSFNDYVLKAATVAFAILPKDMNWQSPSMFKMVSIKPTDLFTHAAELSAPALVFNFKRGRGRGRGGNWRGRGSRGSRVNRGGFWVSDI